jgi:hypothetical protein
VSLLVTELEWREKGVFFDVYFDTSEIRDAALGAESYLTKSGHFEEERRRQPRALIQTLLSAGWLGQVRLLTPHQSELLTKITFDFVSLTESTFYQAVEHVSASLQKSRAEAQSADLIDSARQTSRAAIAEFISIEASRLSWRKRLAEWRTRGILSYDTIPTDYAQLLRSDDYNVMERALAAERPDMTINNVNDAAAIATVTAALRDYEAGNTKRIPLLYVGTTTIRRALEQKLMSKLTVELEKDRHLTVIRDWTYFVVRSIFRPARTALGAAVTQMTLTELRHLRDQLRTVIVGQQRISSNVLVHLKLGEQEINEQVDTFVELCFYRNVWLPYKERPNVQAIEEATERASNERVLKALDEIQARFRVTAEQYDIIGGFWARVTAAVDELSLKTKSSPDLDHIRAFGAFRFSPSPRAIEDATRFFKGVAAGTPESRGKELHGLLLEYLELRKGLNVVGKELAERTAVILWTLKLDDTIVDLFSGASGWMEVLYAAAILRSGREIERVERIMSRLESEIPHTTPSAKLRVSIALAYLSFHLALRREFQPSWLPVRTRSNSDDVLRLVAKAAEYACSAADDQYVRRSALQVYALNQSLYYLIAVGSDDRDDLITRADRLLPFKPHPNEWDYRYDDTLARYYYYLATTAVTDERRADNAALAKQHIDAAFAAAHGDSEVETFRSILGNFRERISQSSALLRPR